MVKLLKDGIPASGEELSPAVRGLLMALRNAMGAGPLQLLLLLRRLPYDRLPAVSTWSLILRQEGLVEPQRRARRDPELRGPAGPYSLGGVRTSSGRRSSKASSSLGIARCAIR